MYGIFMKNLAYKIEKVNLRQKSFMRSTPGVNVVKKLLRH
jgi:hypothetical protein